LNTSRRAMPSRYPCTVPRAASNCESCRRNARNVSWTISSAASTFPGPPMWGGVAMHRHLVTVEQLGKGALVAPLHPFEQPEVIHSDSIASQRGKGSLHPNAAAALGTPGV
jgi:hypothetical protein